MRDPAHHKNEIEGSVTYDLIGYVHVTASGVHGFRRAFEQTLPFTRGFSRDSAGRQINYGRRSLIEWFAWRQRLVFSGLFDHHMRADTLAHYQIRRIRHTLSDISHKAIPALRHSFNVL